jgi:hypothetical protein
MSLISRDLDELVQNDAKLFTDITIFKDYKQCNSIWAESDGASRYNQLKSFSILAPTQLSTSSQNERGGGG